MTKSQQYKNKLLVKKLQILKIIYLSIRQADRQTDRQADR